MCILAGSAGAWLGNLQVVREVRVAQKTIDLESKRVNDGCGQLSGNCETLWQNQCGLRGLHHVGKSPHGSSIMALREGDDTPITMIGGWT